MTSAGLETVPDRRAGTCTFDSTTSNGSAGDRRSASRALGAPAPSADGRFAFFAPARADVEADRAFEVGNRLPTAGCPRQCRASMSAKRGQTRDRCGVCAAVAPLSLLALVTQVKGFHHLITRWCLERFNDRVPVENDRSVRADPAHPDGVMYRGQPRTTLSKPGRSDGEVMHWSQLISPPRRNAIRCDAR